MKNKAQSGFTLVELMIVVVIVGILAAVSYPSYRNYVIKTNRAAAESVMLGIANKQEQFLLDARKYFCTAGCSTALTDSTTPPLPYTIPVDVARNYTISVAAPDLTLAAPVPTYTVTATPIGSQASGDTKCKNLTLTQAGTKGINGGTSTNPADCW